MDDLTRMNSVVEGDNSKKSYCIVTGNRSLHGISRLQLENLQHRIELFREKEKTARKRMKEDLKDFWFSIEIPPSLLRFFTYIFIITLFLKNFKF